jgi:hypothetical protein
MIKIAAYLTGFNRKADRSCSVRFETQEVSTDELMELDKHYGDFGWLVFSPNEVRADDIPTEQTEDKNKTPSKRLRSTLYILWKQRGSAGDFEVFYREQVEKIIIHIKTKLDE